MEVKMKVLFVSSELLMMFTPPPPPRPCSHIPQRTENPHMLLNLWENDREEEYSCVHLIRTWQKKVVITEITVCSFYSFLHWFLYHFLFCMYVCISFNKFCSCFSPQKRLKLMPVLWFTPNLSDIKSQVRCVAWAALHVLKLVLLPGSWSHR